MSAFSLKQIERKVAILGPLAGNFGRDLEFELATRKRPIEVIPMHVVANSINNHSGTLREEHFESEPMNKGSWERQKGRSHWNYYDSYQEDYKSGAHLRAASSSSRR